MQCPQCASVNRDGAKFCSECGTRLLPVCASCQAELRAGARFCDECGIAVTPNVEAGPPVAEAQAVARARAERRQLTVMFCDLAESTALSTRMDPEEYRDVILAYQQTCTTAVEQFEGYVARYLGDGMLVYFGYPLAHEDDAERAVRAGLAVVDAVANERQYDIDLAVRVGIATGPVVVGDIVGEGAAQESTVLGETPNLAARLQGLAAPNSVVVSSTTRSLLGELFRFADLGEHRLKGLSDPVQAWTVSPTLEQESRFEASHTGELTPLVGREEELQILSRRWQLASQGEGQVALISGEAGIGKSRLTQALTALVRQQDHRVVRYQCSPYHVNSALYPIIAHLGRAAGFSNDDDNARRLAKLEEFLRDAGMDAATVVPLYAPLLSIDASVRYPALQMAVEQQKDETLEALTEQLFRLETEGPVLFVFEDAHWIDRSSHELLELALSRIGDKRMLFVITHRPEFQAAWLGEANVTSLVLSKLMPRSIASLITSLTGNKPLPAEVLEQITEKTDGVPLFVEELTKTILDLELLVEHGDRYELAGPLPTLAIPSTLQDSLMARLDRLSAVKDIAQTGAVIGREFSQELLQHVAGIDEAALNEALAKLVAAGLIFRRGTPPSASYTFKHALIRDTAYESLLMSRRRVLHGRIASALEENFPAVVTGSPELLGYHCSEAQEYERAIGYWLAAGARAAEQSAPHDAGAHIGKGLELLERITPSIERDRLELKLRMELARALQATVGWGAKEQVEVVRRARELAVQLDETSSLLEVQQKERVRHWIRGEYREARELSWSNERLAREMGFEFDSMVNIYARGWPTLMMGDLAAVPALASAIFEHFDRSRDDAYRFVYGIDVEMANYCLYGHERWLSGFPLQAEKALDKAIAIARELDHGPSIAWVLTWGGAQPAAIRRDHDRALLFSTELLALDEKQRSPLDAAWARVCHGWSLGKTGELEQGIASIQAAIDFLDGSGYKLMRGLHLVLLAELYLDAGDLDRVEQTLDVAARHIAATAERVWEPDVLALKGRLAAARDDPDAAQQRFTEALAAARGMSATALALRSAVCAVRTLAGTSAGEAWRGKLAEILGHFDEGDVQELMEARTLAQRTP